MTSNNAEIRTAAKRANVYLYEIAKEIGISDPTMTRKMRYELTKAEKEKFLSIIDRLGKSKEIENEPTT